MLRKLSTLHAHVISLLLLFIDVPVAGFIALPPASLASKNVKLVNVNILASKRLRNVNHGLNSVSSLAERVVEQDRVQTFGLSLSGGAEDKLKQEFELNRGKAVDTLLSDYPTIFTESCDFSIFHPSITLRDTQGFSIEGIGAYRAFFSIVPSLANVLFSRCEVSAVLMDKYGLCKNKIKIRWRIDFFPRFSGMSTLKDIFRWVDSNGDGVISSKEFFEVQKRMVGGHTGRKSPLVVEGISSYTLNAKAEILLHEIEVTSPTNYPFLESLRELLPVRRTPEFVRGVPSFYHPPAALQPTLYLESTKTLPGPPGGDNDEGVGAQLLGAILGKENVKKLPKQCKEDYDCNPGGYNFPLRCVDFIIARFCVDPDDWRGGGLGALSIGPEYLVPEPIPVRVEDGWTR